MFQITNFPAIDQLLQHSPDGVVNRIEVCAVWWPVVQLDEVGHCFQSTYQCYQFGQFFVLNRTTFVSSIVLQETRISCDQHSSHFELVKTSINALSSEVSGGHRDNMPPPYVYGGGMFTQMTSTMTQSIYGYFAKNI